MNNFELAFASVISHEGGYVNDPADPGGETKYGISKRSYPDVDIAALTLEQAKSIYERDFWAKIRGDELPYAIAVLLFDFAVNSGVHQAIKSLQSVIGAKADGVLGPVTIDAIMRRSLRSTVIDYQAERIVFNASLPTWPRFGRGWARRVIAQAIDSLNKE